MSDFYEEIVKLPNYLNDKEPLKDNELEKSRQLIIKVVNDEIKKLNALLSTDEFISSITIKDKLCVLNGYQPEGGFSDIGAMTCLADLMIKHKLVDEFDKIYKYCYMLTFNPIKKETFDKLKK